MNRLQNETSPYLLQHANNPVEWWPWCPDAFAEAESRNLPVLLSVGYSTCHWCHVMAHESFENEQTAELMNAHFVNIKVDREERPDIDAVYMAATQALSGQGGWPMTVFLTPDARPFYAGTYFPPTEGIGLPSFGRVLERISTLWQQQRGQILENATALSEHLTETLSAKPASVGQFADPQAALAEAVADIANLYDAQQGGFGQAPKFPAPTLLDFLLSQPQGRQMAWQTLRAMGQGGIYDQLGGGFHRYSVDEYWLVPHFEKMLYDNAQLIRPLLRTYQQTNEEFFAQLVRQTLSYLEREMLHEQGGFYSAQDADTQGVEGLTFTWTPDEVRAVLGEQADEALAAYGISEAGNFRDPHRPEYGSRSVLSQRQTADSAIAQSLLMARQQRPQPQTDRKVLTSWNGLALVAFAEAARVLQSEHYLQIAKANAQFVHSQMRQPDGTLLHSFLDGQAKVEGLLEDHALYGLGLVALFQASGEQHYLEWARELWQIICRDFWNESAGVFFATGGKAERLLVRHSEAFDSAVLSDNAAAGQLAYWMHTYFSLDDALAQAKSVVAAFSREMQISPTGFGGLWQLLELTSGQLRELVILGDSQQRAPFEQVTSRFDLWGVAVASLPSDSNLPAATGRKAGEAYWCAGRSCRQPAQTGPQLEQLLAGELG